MAINYDDELTDGQVDKDELDARFLALKTGVNAALQNRGEYDDDATYDPNDLVWHEEKHFYALQEVSGTTPSTEANEWRLLGSVAGGSGQGGDGQNGADGQDGSNGQDGVDGQDGADGTNGWSPVLAVVADGERRVQQVADWLGGTGTKPAVGLYVGATGFVADIENGADIRGAVGTDGQDGADGQNGSGGGGSVTIADQAEAEAGLENTKMMTPLRVAQAISALASQDGDGNDLPEDLTGTTGRFLRKNAPATGIPASDASDGFWVEHKTHFDLSTSIDETNAHLLENEIPAANGSVDTVEWVKTDSNNNPADGGFSWAWLASDGLHKVGMFMRGNRILRLFRGIVIGDGSDMGTIPLLSVWKSGAFTAGKPGLRWNATASKIEFSHDGSTFEALGSGDGGSGSGSACGGTFTVATVPDAATRAGQTIYVTDGAYGAPCFAASNGTAWIRLTEGVEISDTFDPTTLSGLMMWLKADAITGLANGADVTNWLDSSGNGNNAPNPYGGGYPTYQTYALNALPVVRFNGSTQALYPGDLSASFPSAATMFVVATINNDDSYSLYETGGISPMGYWRYGGDGHGYIGAFRSSRLNGYPSSPPTSGTHTWTLESSSSNYELWIDGISQGAQAAAYDAGSDHQISHDPKFGGDIAEIIIYNRVLTNEERTAVQNYLGDKYNIDPISAEFEYSDIGGLVGRFQARQLTGLSNGDAVSSWTNTGSVGGAVTQSNNSYKPEYVTNAYNGLPCLRASGSGRQLSSGVITNSTQYTAIAVCTTSQGSGGSVFYNGHFQPTANGYALSMTKEAGVHYGGVVGTQLASPQFPVGVNVFALRRSGSITTLYVNGVEKGSVSQAPNTPSTDFAIFAGDLAYPFLGDICDLFIWDNAISLPNLEAATTQLMSDYNIVLPTTYPSTGLIFALNAEDPGSGSTWNDSGPNNLDGTLEDDAHWGTYSNVSEVQPNYSGRVAIADNSAFHGLTQFTAAVWVRKDGNDVKPMAKFDAYGGFFFAEREGQLYACLKNASGSQVSGYFDNGVDNGVHLLALVYDGSHMKCYIDSAAQSIVLNQSGALPSNSPTLYLGCEYDGSESQDGGLIRAYFYNVALTDSQIADLYALGY